jgi:hypothetical protein
MADFSQDKKYNYNWQSSKFKNLALSGSYISQFINDAGYVTSSVAISASYALTASYLTGTIASASYATSASYTPNTTFPYTGSARITGSLSVTGSITVGNITSTPSTENTLNIYPSPAGGTGEGGQILLAASGGLYTSASMIDTYQNQFRILKGTNTGGSTASFLTVNLDTGDTTIGGYILRSKPIPSPYISQGILAGNQSIPNNTDTIIDFVDQFDPQNWWNPSTKRFTPTIAGYYQVAFGVWLDNPGTTTGQTNSQCRKNGTTQQIIVQYPLNNGSGQSLAGSKIISMNGTTDYIDFTIYHNAGSAKNILQGNADGSGTWFTSTLLGL